MWGSMGNLLISGSVTWGWITQSLCSFCFSRRCFSAPYSFLPWSWETKSLEMLSTRRSFANWNYPLGFSLSDSLPEDRWGHRSRPRNPEKVVVGFSWPENEMIFLIFSMRLQKNTPFRCELTVIGTFTRPPSLKLTTIQCFTLLGWWELVVLLIQLNVVFNQNKFRK